MATPKTMPPQTMPSDSQMMPPPKTIPQKNKTTKTNKSNRVKKAKKTNPNMPRKRRGSLEVIQAGFRASVKHTARAALAMMKITTKIAKASVGEGPAVVHLHPERARRGSRYTEEAALYQNGSA